MPGVRIYLDTGMPGVRIYLDTGMPGVRSIYSNHIILYEQGNPLDIKVI